jgi:hypothetical protein
MKRVRSEEKAKIVDATRLDEKLADLDGVDDMPKRPRALRQGIRPDRTKTRKGRSR